MSGGSFDYLFYRVEDTYSGEMRDKELNKLMDDLIKVLHDLEWWQSGDISEEDYRKTVIEFKTKWLSGYDKDTNGRIERFKNLLLESIQDQLKEI
jgi:hypothetical protein